MQIGDKVHVVGTVRDIVSGNVLMQTDPVPTDPGREYWFLGPHVLPMTEAEAPPPASEPATTEVTAVKATHTGPTAHTAAKH